MGCVVDHLSSGLTVRVLQDFTDARGIEVLAGERAVIETIELDWSTFELAIEWVRSGQKEVVHFLHKAASGPRNGRMREFFEIETGAPPDEEDSPADGEDVERQRASAPPVVSRETPPPSPRATEAPKSLSPDQRKVACGCDPALYRPVMENVGEVSVNACLRCGTVSVTKCVGDDGRYTGDAWSAYLPVAVSDAVLAWLGRWPRVQSTLGPIRWPMAYELVRSDAVYLPATTRCETAEELVRCEAALAREQAERNPGQRLRDAGFPSERPPSGLPESLTGFSVVWQALQLGPSSKLSDLLSHARLRSPSSGVAVDLLTRRSDAVAVMLESLKSDDAGARSAGIALARELRPVSPELEPTLLGILDHLPLTPAPETPGRIAACQRFESLLVLIADLKLATPAVLEALSRYQRRLARHDATLVSCCQIVGRELRGEPPPPPFGFLP